MDEKTICRAALDTWGAAAQTLMLFEEMGELMQAVGKVNRAMPCDTEIALDERISHVAEEIADVEIMLAQIVELFGVDGAVKEWKRAKLVRLENRIREHQREKAKN